MTEMRPVPNAADPPLPDDAPVRAEDYMRMAAAIRFIHEHRLEHPALEDIAAHLGLSPSHFQRLFTRWAGVSPKRYLSVLTHAHARSLLSEGASLLDGALETGLSGPGRLHDLFVSLEAMSPGEVKSGGAGLTLSYGWHDSPFGLCLIVTSPRGVTGLAFADPSAEDQARVFTDMQARWPNAAYREDGPGTARLIRRIFEPKPRDKRAAPLQLLVGGTQWQVKVWRALLDIPPGQATTYERIAETVCTRKAVRAVGTAVGRNPISFLIPCHRVLRKSGELGGYHWGLERKRAILAWEGVRG